MSVVLRAVVERGARVRACTKNGRSCTAKERTPRGQETPQPLTLLKVLEAGIPDPGFLIRLCDQPATDNDNGHHGGDRGAITR